MERARHGCLAKADPFTVYEADASGALLPEPLWKEGESVATSVFHAFLGAICERPLRILFVQILQYKVVCKCLVVKADNIAF